MKTYIPVEKIVEIYNRIDGFVPKNKSMRESKASMLMVLNEVLDNKNEVFDSEIYHDVKREYLKDDARTYVSYYLSNRRGVYSYDIPDEDLDKYDYEYLVDEYERTEDCDSSFTASWESVVWDYMSDLEEDEEDEER